MISWTKVPISRSSKKRRSSRPFLLMNINKGVRVTEEEEADLELGKESLIRLRTLLMVLLAVVGIREPRAGVIIRQCRMVRMLEDLIVEASSHPQPKEVITTTCQVQSPKHKIYSLPRPSQIVRETRSFSAMFNNRKNNSRAVLRLQLCTIVQREVVYNYQGATRKPSQCRTFHR